MLLKIVHKQLMEYVLSVRFLAATLLCLAVGTGATWVRTHTYLEGLTAYRINRQDHGFEARGYVHPYPLTYSGVTVDKRPALLSIFYNGLQPSRPMSVRVTANRDPRTEDQYERANPISDLFQTVDLMSFAALVMSLLALVFSYDLISGEKEAGTLRLMLSFPVPRDKLLLGKWIGGYIALIVPFLLTAFCSLGIVVLYPEVELSTRDLTAFGLLILATLSYISGFYSLGLLVSSVTSRAFTSITALVAVWVGMTVAVPNLSPYIARCLINLPTVQEVEREKWAVAEEGDRVREERGREYRSRTTDSDVQQGVVHAEFWRDFLLGVARDQEQIQSEYERALDRQVRGAVWLSRLSPTASLVYATGEITDTGLGDMRRFRKALQSYRVDFVNYAEDKWVETRRKGNNQISTMDYPRFFYKRPGLAERLEQAMLDLGMLTVWNLLFFTAAHVGFLRYDVR